MTGFRSAPRYFVAVVQSGGQSEALDLTDRVLSFSFCENERKVDKLRLSVDNEDLSNFDDPVWAHGNLLRFSYGYADEVAPIREAIIRKVTGGRTLTVEAHAKSVLMDKSPRRRRFDNKTRSEVVRDIAAENGFTDNIDIEDTDEVFETITQANYTDAQFLRKLAHLEGFEFFVDFDGLHWHRRKVGQTPLKKLTYYNDPGLGSIIDFNVENDVTRKPGRVRVRSRDPIKRETIDEVSEDSTETGRDVMQEIPNIGRFDPESGALLVSAGAPASPQAAVPQETAAQEVTRPSNVQTLQDGKREAKGRFIKTQQVAVKMVLTIIGDPGILAKSVIEIENMGRRLSGKYYVRAAEHTLSPSVGYETKLSLITDGFQHPLRGGGRGGSGASSTALGAALLAFTQALQATTVTSLVAPGTALSNQIAALVPDVSSAGARSGAKSAANFARAAKSAGDANLSAAAANLAAVLRRFITEEEQTTSGKLNEISADDADAGKLGRFDTEFGTLYIDKRGRE